MSKYKEMVHWTNSDTCKWENVLIIEYERFLICWLVPSNSWDCCIAVFHRSMMRLSRLYWDFSCTNILSISFPPYQSSLGVILTGLKLSALHSNLIMSKINEKSCRFFRPQCVSRSKTSFITHFDINTNICRQKNT